MNKNSATDWYRLADTDSIDSPALLVYPDRIRENLRRIIAIVDDPRRLWLHIKTHKMREVILLAIDAGITKFKAATIAEAELVASSGGSELLLAYPPVGPKIDRFSELIASFPETSFSTIGDDEAALRQLYEETPGPETPVAFYVRKGHPAPEILECAEEAETDLIVMSTHGVGNDRRFLLGSVTERVVRSAPHAVLTLKAFGKSLVEADAGQSS